MSLIGFIAGAWVAVGLTVAGVWLCWKVRWRLAQRKLRLALEQAKTEIGRPMVPILQDLVAELCEVMKDPELREIMEELDGDP